MLADVERHNQFKRDYKRMVKQNKNISLLDNLIVNLFEEKTLPLNYHDHNLVGNYNSFRECHIAGIGDWLLIYKIKNNVLILARTGSHSELFE
jgi:mRNA interferase YafQ